MIVLLTANLYLGCCSDSDSAVEEEEDSAMRALRMVLMMALFQIWVCE